jgi:phage-related tail protein
MHTTSERMQGAIGTAGHQASDTARNLGEKAHGVAEKIAECADQAKESMQKLASQTADTVVHAKEKVVNWATDAAQHPGEYLKAGGDELTDLIRRYPIPALLVGVGVGFMLARAFRA